MNKHLAWINDRSVPARVSHSQINMFLNCPRQWAFRYVDGVIAPPGVSMIRGSSVHTAAESNYRSVIETGEALEVEAVKAIAADDVETRFRGGVRLADEEAASGLAKVRGSVKDDAVSLAEIHAVEVAPTHDPIAVEESHIITNAETGNKVKIIVDMRELDSLHDIKTGSKAPASTVADKSMQLTLYSAGFLVLTGALPREVVLDYVIRTAGGKTTKPKTYSKSYASKRTLEDIKAAFRVVENVVESMRKGVSHGNPTSNLCSPKWCGYYGRCPYVSK